MATLSVDVTIHNTLGAILVGFAIACAIYGILFSQVFTYFSNYPLDRMAYKFLVVLLLCAFICCFVYSITHAPSCRVLKCYGDRRSSSHRPYIVLLRDHQLCEPAGAAERRNNMVTDRKSHLTLPDRIKSDQSCSVSQLQQTIGATVGAIVKTNFALRVWRFSERNWFITSFIMILVLGQLGLAFAYTIKAFRLPNLFAVVHLRTLGTIALAVGVLTDIVIAIALCYFLNKLRTGYQRSDTLVNSLVRYAVNTGAVTGAVSLTTLILYNLMPANLIFVSTYFILSKFYAISFMATLNTRRVVRGKGTDKQGTSNNTNMFHLGTRQPSIVANELDMWETAHTYTLTTSQGQLSSGGQKLKSPISPISPHSQISHPYANSQDPFPLNTFHPGSETGANAYPPSRHQTVYGQAF
ncbi:hypothetical protein PM082_003941 [Marasmius tenuissimus]|nr:hypothetical protein PM082_003941 [Marasmius tenuissimus]